MERRWGNRVQLDERVRITRDGAVIGFATLHEASISGAFVRTPLLVRNLARIELELAPSGARKDPQRCAEAFVVRQCPDGFGVEWCEFGPPTIVELLREPQLYVQRGERAPVGQHELTRR
jgi:hypothetical protein